MPRISCARCVFYVHITTNQGVNTRGKCRRFPPLVYFDTHAKQPSELWPTVNENWWCGEFRKPKPPGGHQEQREQVPAHASRSRER